MAQSEDAVLTHRRRDAARDASIVRRASQVLHRLEYLYCSTETIGDSAAMETKTGVNQPSGVTLEPKKPATQLDKDAVKPASLPCLGQPETTGSEGLAQPAVGKQMQDMKTENPVNVLLKGGAPGLQPASPAAPLDAGSPAGCAGGGGSTPPLLRAVRPAVARKIIHPHKLER